MNVGVRQSQLAGVQGSAERACALGVRCLNAGQLAALLQEQRWVPSLSGTPLTLLATHDRLCQRKRCGSQDHSAACLVTRTGVAPALLSKQHHDNGAAAAPSSGSVLPAAREHFSSLIAQRASPSDSPACVTPANTWWFVTTSPSSDTTKPDPLDRRSADSRLRPESSRRTLTATVRSPESRRCSAGQQALRFPSRLSHVTHGCQRRPPICIAPGTHPQSCLGGTGIESSCTPSAVTCRLRIRTARVNLSPHMSRRQPPLLRCPAQAVAVPGQLRDIVGIAAVMFSSQR